MKADNLFRTNNLEVLVTGKCNLRCKYCFEGKEHVGKDTDLKSIEGYLKKNGSREFYTFGGEPLVNLKGIGELVDFVEQNTDIRYRGSILYSMRMITTNGTLVKKNLDLIKKYKLRLQISLDGDKEGDNQRVYANGKASFPDVEEAIKLCLENDIEFTTHGVLNMINAKRYSHIIEYLFSQYLDHYKDIDKAIGYFAHNFSMMIIEGEYTDKFIDAFLDELGKLAKWINKLPLTTKQKIDLFNNVIQRKSCYGICGASTGLKVSDASGNIYPCHRSNETEGLSLGNFMDNKNLKNQNIYNAWNDIKRKGFMYSVEGCKLSSSGKSEEPWTYWCPATNRELGTVDYINPKYVILNKEIARFTNYLRELYSWQ